MKYSLEELYGFMESGRQVKVTCTDGTIFTGRCWAYSGVNNLEEDGIDEPSLEVKDTILYLSDIEKIEYVD